MTESTSSQYPPSLPPPPKFSFLNDESIDLPTTPIFEQKGRDEIQEFLRKLSKIQEKFSSYMLLTSATISKRLLDEVERTWHWANDLKDITKHKIQTTCLKIIMVSQVLGSPKDEKKTFEVKCCDSKESLVLSPQVQACLKLESGYFRSLISGEMKESKEGVLNFPDLCEEPFKDLLNHLLMDEIPLDHRFKLLNLIQAGAFFQMGRIENQCLNLIDLIVYNPDASNLELMTDLLIYCESTLNKYSSLSQKCLFYALQLGYLLQLSPESLLDSDLDGPLNKLSELKTLTPHLDIFRKLLIQMRKINSSDVDTINEALDKLEPSLKDICRCLDEAIGFFKNSDLQNSLSKFSVVVNINKSAFGYTCMGVACSTILKIFIDARTYQQYLSATASSFEEALKTKFTNYPFALINYAMVLISLGSFEHAQKCLIKISKDSNYYPMGLALQGYLLIEQSKLKEAERCLVEGHKLDQNNYYIRMFNGFLKIKLKNESAIDDLNLAIEGFLSQKLNRLTVQFLQLALIFRSQINSAHNDKAIKDLTLAIDLKPNHIRYSFEALVQRGKLHLQQGLYEEAKKDLIIPSDVSQTSHLTLSAIDGMNLSYYARARLGECFRLTNDEEIAKGYFDEVLNRYPTDVWTLSRRAMCDVGQDEESAISFFTRALVINPNDVFTLLNRGKAYLFNEEYDDAKIDLQKAESVDPHNPMVKVYLGITYLYEDHPLAENYLNAALIDDPNNAIAYAYRGEFYRLAASKQISNDEAQKYRNWAALDFKKALSINPDEVMAMEGQMSLAEDETSLLSLNQSDEE